MQFGQTCPHCQGTGYIVTNGCKTCGGTGRVVDTKVLSVDIPAGVDSGNKIRLSGQGEAGLNGGAAGDLYVFIEVKEHEIFQRDGSDLYCEVPISFTTAALGGKVEVPTLEGPVMITIAEGTQTNKTMRLSGKGIKSYGFGGKGDLYCKIVVETPVNLTSEQKDLLKKLEASLNGEATKDSSDSSKKDAASTNKVSHKPKSEGFLNKVKKFLDDLSS